MFTESTAIRTAPLGAGFMCSHSLDVPHEEPREIVFQHQPTLLTSLQRIVTAPLVPGILSKAHTGPTARTGTVYLADFYDSLFRSCAP